MGSVQIRKRTFIPLSSYSDLLREWHPVKNLPILPTTLSYGSQKKVWWRHWSRKDQVWHEWIANPKSRTGKDKQGCAICRGLQIQVGVNDLASQSKDTAREWHPTRNGTLTAKMVTVNSAKDVWWRHWHKSAKQWHEWMSRPNDRASGYDCPFCAGQKVLSGFNDLATKCPTIAREWHPTKNKKLTASQVTKQSRAAVWWRHKSLTSNEIHIWKSAVYSRTGKKPQGCPNCAVSGFDVSKPAHLYIIQTKIERKCVIQFGISNIVEHRLMTHKKSGFIHHPIALLAFEKGSQALDLENKLLHLMEDYNLDSCFVKNILFPGASEAFCLEDADEGFLEEFTEALTL